MTIQDNLKILRGEMTQAEFAMRLGTRQSTVTKWETGKASPGKKYLQRIQEQFGVSVDWLISGVGEPFPRGAQTKRSDTDIGPTLAYCIPGRGTPSQPAMVFETPAPQAQPPHGVLHDYAAARAPISPEEMVPAVEIPEPPPCDPAEFGLVPMSAARLSAGGGAFVITEEIKGYYAFRKDWLHRIASSPRNLVLMKVEGDSMGPTLHQGDAVLIDVGKRHIYPGRIYALGIDDTIMIKRLEPLMDGSVRVISDNRADYPPQLVARPTLRVIGQVIWYARELV